METVRIDKYDEKWPLMFQEEKRKVEEIMAEKAIAFEHIGSTAVPGLSSKAVIDFMVGVKDLAEVEAFIESFPHDRVAYTNAKHPFITEILTRLKL